MIFDIVLRQCLAFAIPPNISIVSNLYVVEASICHPSPSDAQYSFSGDWQSSLYSPTTYLYFKQ